MITHQIVFSIPHSVNEEGEPILDVLGLSLPDAQPPAIAFKLNGPALKA